MKTVAILLTAMLMTAQAFAQTVIPLYDGKIPNAKETNVREKIVIEKDGKQRVSNITVPTLTAYFPEQGKANGTAVIICPGGGYVRLSIEHEGYEVAKAFAAQGITAFVLKYRQPDTPLVTNRTVVPLQDAQRALQLVRQRAAGWGIDTERIGMMGFSAGGHLASTAGTHFKNPVIDPAGISLRPDFLILMYPVISFRELLMHKGSRDRLIGPDATPALTDQYSGEINVTGDTPPTFLVHAGDDPTVSVNNSIQFYLALQQHKVPAELHIYPHGGHGFGLNNKTTPDQWWDRLMNWMHMNHWLK